MPRKSRILKEHILAAALELIKDEGFENFTARRIAEYLNASTQPIYKEFENMDDLKERLIDHAKDLIQMDVFKGRRETITLNEVCANYIRFAKKEATLFCALFMGREAPAMIFHECALASMNDLLKEMHELEGYEERQAYLEIIWPSIHGTAVLTAQGQFHYSDEEIDEKAEHIVNHSLATWKNS